MVLVVGNDLLGLFWFPVFPVASVVRCKNLQVKGFGLVDLGKVQNVGRPLDKIYEDDDSTVGEFQAGVRAAIRPLNQTNVSSVGKEGEPAEVIHPGYLPRVVLSSIPG